MRKKMEKPLYLGKIFYQDVIYNERRCENDRKKLFWKN